MSASDVEHRLAALLHQHAEEAMDQTDTITELNKFQARVAQDTRRRSWRTAGTAAAAVTVAAVGVGALWFGLGQGEAPAPGQPAPPVASPSPSGATEDAEAPQTPGSIVEGFEGVESFPMTFVVPDGFTAVSEGGGTRAYTIDGTSGGATAFLISTFNKSRTGDLPADLAADIEGSRPDLIVSEVGTTQVGGRPAQTFTLAQKRGTAPTELFCVRSGSCFKLLEDKPLDVTVVRTARGLVLFWVEYLPKDQAKVQEPMKNWLSSVRWQ